MPTRETLAHVEAFWAGRLGCGPQDLHRPGVTLLRNGGELAGYRGAFLLRWGAACVFTVPARFEAPVKAAIRGRDVDAVFDSALLAHVFAGYVERIVGPAFQGCADGSDFRPTDARGARMLSVEDEAALNKLELACAPEEWEHAAIEPGHTPIFGCFAGGTLVTAGTLIAWGSQLRNVGIVTHPAQRGRGYGRAVVAALTAHALGEGAVAQYQTLLSNAGALAIARALGYQQYATTLAIRIAG